MIPERMGRPYFELFRQPPALLRQPDGDMGTRENPMAVNIENLPGGYNYYYAMPGGEEQKNQGHMCSGLCGSSDGIVFPEFNEPPVIDRLCQWVLRSYLSGTSVVHQCV